MLGAKTGSGIRVVEDHDRTLPLVPALAAELDQVWTNLIDNALGAMAGSGTLTLRTSVQGDSAVVEVADTGPGIPEQVRRRVSEPCSTTEPVGQGTGLGLDVAWRIVTTRHGGVLEVRSEPGDTRFVVRLPPLTTRPGLRTVACGPRAWRTATASRGLPGCARGPRNRTGGRGARDGVPRGDGRAGRAPGPRDA